MSDYVDNFDWGMEFEKELDETDWTRLYDEVRAGPYGAIWEENEAEQRGAEEGVMQEADRIQPVERDGESPQYFSQSSTTNRERMISPTSQQDQKTLSTNEAPGSDDLITTATATVITFNNGANLTCDFLGCSSRPFKRIGDLNRHKKKHESQRKYSCTAKDCPRVGPRGFSRNDKLRDHMLAGHDDDTTFMCSRCSSPLPRDLMSVHDYDRHSFNRYRTCPMPRCSFKVYVRWNSKTGLDKLAVHLQEKHELKHRNNFANLLRQQGYDAQTCGVVCPICPGIGYFLKHEDFHEHFMQMHFRGPACGMLKWVKNHGATCTHDCSGRTPYQRFSECTYIPDEVKQHRRTILRVWPAFVHYPVWNDIRRCNEYSSVSQG